MGYAGKVVERERAVAMRERGMLLADIAVELGVSLTSVSRWVGGADPDGPRAGRRPSSLAMDRLAKDAAARDWADAVVAAFDRQALLAAGVALYAGEGAKSSGWVGFVNTDPRMVAFVLAWLRAFFSIDEAKLRARLHLHDGLDLVAATERWSEVTGITPERFTAPHRARPTNAQRPKHLHGCCTVRYHSKDTLRLILALCDALLKSPSPFRDSSAGRAFDC